MSAGVMLVKSFSAGSGENNINRLQVALYKTCKAVLYFQPHKTQNAQNINDFLF